MYLIQTNCIFLLIGFMVPCSPRWKEFVTRNLRDQKIIYYILTKYRHLSGDKKNFHLSKIYMEKQNKCYDGEQERGGITINESSKKGI